MKKVVTLATALCLASMPAFAGSLSPAAMESTVQAPVVPAVPVAGRSMGNTGLIAAGAGVLVLAALAASSSSSSTATTTE